jgi:hypothetical protein
MDNRHGTDRQQVKTKQRSKKTQFTANMVTVCLDIPKTDRRDKYGHRKSRHYVVDGGRVVKRCRDYRTIHKAFKQYPDAIILEVKVERATDREMEERQLDLRVAREIRDGKFDFVLDDQSLYCVSYDSTEKVNPRATPLDIESGFIGYFIEVESDGLIDTDGPRGTVYDESVHGSRLQRMRLHDCQHRKRDGRKSIRYSKADAKADRCMVAPAGQGTRGTAERGR